MNTRPRKNKTNKQRTTSPLIAHKTYGNVIRKVKKQTSTRRAWQSQTRGRPAPQVRVQNQFQEDEIPLAVMASRIKKFSENTSTIPEVMDSSTLNFKAKF